MYIEKIKNRILLFMIVVFVGTMIPFSVNATSVSLGSVAFDEHAGMSVTIKGSPAFCIQRGYPFRSKVSDIQMMRVNHGGESITMADWIRKTMISADNTNVKFFAGWGNWNLNGDHTNVVKAGTDSNQVPSSATINEVFDKETIDGEDAYTNSINNVQLEQFRSILMTGHEGAKSVYGTTLKNASYSQLGLTKSQVNALAFINYYIYKDASANGFSSTAKNQAAQALVWGVEFGFVDTVGMSSSSSTASGNVYMIFKNSQGKYKSGGSVIMSGTISCDEYIQKYIGNQYEAMKLYRQFVWKMNNLRTIPSFSYEAFKDAYRNPIHLKWDGAEKAYVAKVADANGVLKYFDFEISGITCTENADGTLTIKSSNPISGIMTNYADGNGAKSKLLPDDSKFSLPVCYRWDLEGTTKTFTYTALTVDNDNPHSHDYAPGCEWRCTVFPAKPDRCTHVCVYGDWDDYSNCQHHCNNDCEGGELDCTNTSPFHQHDASCYSDEYCGHNHGIECRACNHTHTNECLHRSGCPCSFDEATGMPGATTEKPGEKCEVEWVCRKIHYKASQETVTAQYIDWQDMVSFEASSAFEFIDPVNAYIAVVTDSHEFPAETDVEIQLIDQNGKIADHVKVGEIYKLRYIYTYEGASKGFKINSINATKSYYQFYYTTKMQTPSTAKLYDLKNSASAVETASVPYSSLAIEKTPVQILGIYTTVETAYPENTYTFDSRDTWNDKIYLDALTSSSYDSHYNCKSEEEIVKSSENASLQKKKVEAVKANNQIKVTWTYETEYEVFTSPVINATALIRVGEDENYVSTYFDEKYNYGDMENHNRVGGEGYFSTNQNGNLINGHVISTQNNEYVTYALKNQIWQSDVEIKTSNPILNTGAGITEAIYCEPGKAYHDVNYNLYYTIEVRNPTAHIYWNKIRRANNNAMSSKTEKKQTIDTKNDVYEFDLNTLISFGGSGSTLSAFDGKIVTVDHVKTGITYLQRTIPTRLTTLKNGTARMTAKIYPNYDRLIYEDAYQDIIIEENGTELSRRFKMTLTANHYPENEVKVDSIIYPAMNPNIAKPVSIENTEDYDNISTFYIRLSNGVNTKIHDRLTKSYKQYAFSFNTNHVDNKVTFGSHRYSKMFFKYSNTSYVYNKKTVNAATGVFSPEAKTQTEKYYISEVLFKSSYTSKKNYGEKEDGWVDMVKDNEKAIVAAGQGFELKVTVKYENTFLTQYLARYFGYEDGQNFGIGSSAYQTPQYCNISAMTGGYISGYHTLDRLAINLVTGSNVYKDLYVYMSDNPNTVYSAMGMYATPIIFDREISYSEDYSVTTITYTMKKSAENGIVSNFQNMKFYTNQLASDSKTPGIVYNGNLPKGKHSITIWTPIVAATPFDYPAAMQDRYIGDAIELGYTIETSAADSSIVHIVQ